MGAILEVYFELDENVTHFRPLRTLCEGVSLFGRHDYASVLVQYQTARVMNS
jgi:hypothetical protein